jgi:hypothetical protein
MLAITYTSGEIHVHHPHKGISIRLPGASTYLGYFELSTRTMYVPSGRIEVKSTGKTAQTCIERIA